MNETNFFFKVLSRTMFVSLVESVSQKRGESMSCVRVDSRFAFARSEVGVYRHTIL